MQTACVHCGTSHVLNDAQIGKHPRVQYLCLKCGQKNIVEVPRRTEQTLVISPLPAFARSGGGSVPGIEFGGEYEGLTLPAGRTITLSMIGGPAKGQVFPLSKPRVVLGRSEADVVIEDPEVSRWHCAIEVKNDVIRLRDLESTNGTFINQERIRAAELKHLSEFRIGSTIVLLTVTARLAG